MHSIAPDEVDAGRITPRTPLGCILRGAGAALALLAAILLVGTGVPQVAALLVFAFLLGTEVRCDHGEVTGAPP